MVWKEMGAAGLVKGEASKERKRWVLGNSLPSSCLDPLAHVVPCTHMVYWQRKIWHRHGTCCVAYADDWTQQNYLRGSVV